MGKARETLDGAMSRRHLMWMTGLGSLGLLIGPRAAVANEAGPEEQMNAVLDSVASIHETEPGLEGFQAALLITSAAFADRTDEEIDLLAGRLYYQSVKMLGQAGEGGSEIDLSGEALAQALSTAPDTDELDRELFDDLLADTKSRIEVDNEFAAAIANGATQARRERLPCYIEDERIPCWLFWIVAAVIVTAFVAYVTLKMGLWMLP